jgi:hypothetical protein
MTTGLLKRAQTRAQKRDLLWNGMLYLFMYVFLQCSQESKLFTFSFPEEAVQGVNNR